MDDCWILACFCEISSDIHNGQWALFIAVLDAHVDQEMVKKPAACLRKAAGFPDITFAIEHGRLFAAS
jgi:hypothetical protein